MWQSLKTTISQWWDNTKSWFKYSETILIARLTAFAGLVTAALGALDWSSISSTVTSTTGFNSRQVISVGIFALVQGVIIEWARRRNADI
jgi:hypothetical protein